MKRNSSKLKILNFTLWFCAFSFAFYAFPALAAVEKLEFMTPAQTVAPGVISEKITVQTQNVAGDSETIGKTADVTFISSSPTGEFLNESGDPVKTTWNSNWANRTFYYRDSSVGSPTLTITVTMRDDGPSFTARQDITMGQQVTPEPPPNPDPVSTPPPSVVESPPAPPVVSNQSSPPAVSPATSTVLSNATIIAPPTLVSVPATVPAAIPSAPAAPTYAAELARLGSELALAAAKLQTAQKREQRAVKAAEPKTPKTAALEPVVTNAVAYDNLAAAAVIEIPKPPSFFERLIAIPRRIWSAITNLFRRR